MVGNHCRFPTVLYLRTSCDALHYSLYVFIYVLFTFISMFIANANIRNKNAKVKLFGVLPFTHHTAFSFRNIVHRLLLQ